MSEPSLTFDSEDTMDKSRYEETSGGRVKTGTLGVYGPNKPNGTATSAGVTANGSISSSTFANGSSLTGTGTSSSSLYSANYRLASLDRLAQRQKLYETNSGNGAGDASNSVSFTVSTYRSLAFSLIPTTTL